MGFDIGGALIEVTAELGIKMGDADVEKAKIHAEQTVRMYIVRTIASRGGAMRERAWFVVGSPALAKKLAVEHLTTDIADYVVPIMAEPLALALSFPDDERETILTRISAPSRRDSASWSKLLAPFVLDARALRELSAIIKAHAAAIEANTLASEGRHAFWRTWQKQDLPTSQEYYAGDAPTERQIASLADVVTTKRLKDPMHYLRWRYVHPDRAFEEAIRILKPDPEAVAKRVVNALGPARFVGSLDGKMWETPSGFVYWLAARPAS